MSKEVFNRKEIKYVLNRDNYNKILDEIKDHIKEDEYPKSTICNIYFDTDNYDLISHSIDKPLYKEKVRLRSYNIPKSEDYVFLEVKKKYEGLVNKRRVKIKLCDFYNYMNDKSLITSNNQIKEEIEYCFNTYNLIPKMFIAYDRTCYTDKDNKNFRITFDQNIRSRFFNQRLGLNANNNANNINNINNNENINNERNQQPRNAFPIWFVKILSKLNLKPTSFSKYGSIYKKKVEVDNYV